MDRLHKIIARAGLMGRRAAEKAIEEGRVKLNGEVVREMGVRASETDHITVDGVLIGAPPAFRTLMVNKPRRVVTTKWDPEGRQTVMDLLPEDARSLNPVGRLDFESEGLLLLTNHGELANRLTHPRYGILKVYHVEVEGPPGPTVFQKLKEGVLLEDGLGHFKNIRPLGTRAFEVTVDEGRNRFIRRMCAAVGHPVMRLQRIQQGPLKLGALRAGSARELTDQEMHELLKAAGIEK